MKTLEITGRSGTCRIFIGGSIKQLEEFYHIGNSVIITDKTVRRLHGDLFPKCEVIEIDEGEESKTLKTVEWIYERFLELEIDRSSSIIGIGGGIVCDIAGFAASTYNRGIHFGFVPTTLLAQVDASIGGKNGVNFRRYKNLIGTFNQPEFVICDFNLLKTLPKSELKNGFAEVIKHGLIGDAELFSFLERHGKEILDLKYESVERVVLDSLNVKARIVAMDELEKDERRKLNFGHTIGHAIEKVTGIRHGEAVSIGIVAAAKLSQNKGMLTIGEAKRIEKVLKEFGLPLEIKADKGSIIDAIRKDKKRTGDDVHFVLLEGIGNAKVIPVKIRELEEVMDDLCEHR